MPDSSNTTSHPSSNPFKLVSKYSPTGDQPQAIRELTASIKSGDRYQTLLWVTWSGKTFTMANLINDLQRPALVMAHNKTLAAQLAQEFKEFFPDNAVHYFVSYYDYYQPEAYIQKSDTYIEKDATINEEIDRLRHAATESLITRKDVIIVASVSCIYGIGNKDAYMGWVLNLKTWEEYDTEIVLDNLINMQFTRSHLEFKPGMFQVLGDVIEVWPASREEVYTLEFFWNDLEKITLREPISGIVRETLTDVNIFPATHSVTTSELIREVVPKIQKELEERMAYFREIGNHLAAERIKTKTEYDIEMMLETGYVKWIENYSRYFDGRKPGMPPMTLMDYFPEDTLTFVDESHITLSQIDGMFWGDKSRKDMLIGNGFRLPSAYDNRPLYFTEYCDRVKQFVCVSATPGNSEIERGGIIAEQVIRPTWLLDPEIVIEDMENMVDSLMTNIQDSINRNERALITTVTKKSSEDLAGWLSENGIKTRYLHSEIDTIERLEILRELREWTIDVIVWVNLLREWLDLPEVSFIGVIDAHKQGFLRSARSLIQIVGRAARNSNGHVIMYSHDKVISPAMQETLDETARRRDIQIAYNKKHAITPTTVRSTIKDVWLKGKGSKPTKVIRQKWVSKEAQMKKIEIEMDIAAAKLDFEKAADLRDQLLSMKK